MTDRLPGGLTDDSDHVHLERNFPVNWSFGKLCTAILTGIFTMILADGWMDGTNNRHTDGWTDFQVESHMA